MNTPLQRQAPWREGLLKRVQWLAFLLGFCQLAGWLGARDWPISLMAHFQLQLGLIALLLLLALVSLGGRVGAKLLSMAVALGVLVVSLLAMAPTLIKSSPDDISSPLRVMVANVNFENRESDGLLEIIRRQQPDLIGLVEYPPGWQGLSDELLGSHPYRLESPSQSPWGLAVFSRYPLNDLRQLESPGGYPAILAELELTSHAPVPIAVVHPPPPVSARLFADRQAYLDWLSDELGDAGNRLLMGDLNLTPWSPVLRDWLDVAALRDTRAGALLPTWPSALGMLGIPLDYILTGDSLSASGLERVAIPSSDHAGLLADIHP